MKRILIPIFETKVYMFKEPDEFNKYIYRTSKNKETEDNILGIAGEYEDKKGKYFLATCITHTKDIEQTVLHEANHVKDFILDNAGVQDTNKEIDSYLLEFVFKKMKAFYC